mmetsp:Transcript_59263/g.139871  ORF Transcript_59263/g.139871 Transcript_59263/m.139871 type:complete len:209 (-) Transcript_59263:862-1488(-)
MSFGGGKRDRTADLLHAMQALSQLSYTPVLIFDSAGIGLVANRFVCSAVQARPRVYDEIQRPCKRSSTFFLSKSSSTASRLGVCARPHTATRTGTANWGILSPDAVSVSLSACWMLDLFQSVNADSFSASVLIAGRTASVTCTARSSAAGLTGAKYITSHSASAATVAQRSLNSPTLGWTCSTDTATPLPANCSTTSAARRASSICFT